MSVVEMVDDTRAEMLALGAAGILAYRRRQRKQAV